MGAAVSAFVLRGGEALQASILRAGDRSPVIARQTHAADPAWETQKMTR